MKIDASGLALAQCDTMESRRPCDCVRCTSLYAAEAIRCGVTIAEVKQDVRDYMQDMASEGRRG